MVLEVMIEEEKEDKREERGKRRESLGGWC
jgi:hypothetical protein